MFAHRWLPLLAVGAIALAWAQPAAAAEWKTYTAGSFTFEAPATWTQQEGPPDQLLLTQSPTDPTAGPAFGVIRQKEFTDLPPGAPAKAEVAGLPGLRYEWSDSDAQGYAILLDAPDADGMRVGFATGAPAAMWEASQPIFEHILGSVTVAAPQAPAVAAEEPALQTATVGRGEPLAFTEAVPAAAQAAVAAVAAYGMQDGAVYRVALVDLNGDGTDEVLVHVKHATWCSGWGDKCRTVVLRHADDGSWVSLGYPYAETVSVLPSRTEGWSDLRFDEDVYHFGYDQYVAAE